jgi:hypothetical protein
MTAASAENTTTEAESETKIMVYTYTYILDELGMSITLPADLAVLTRDINLEDPVISEYGIDAEALKNKLDGSE